MNESQFHHDRQVIDDNAAADDEILDLTVTPKISKTEAKFSKLKRSKIFETSNRKIFLKKCVLNNIPLSSFFEIGEIFLQNYNFKNGVGDARDLSAQRSLRN